MTTKTKEERATELMCWSKQELADRVAELEAQALPEALVEPVESDVLTSVVQALSPVEGTPV